MAHIIMLSTSYVLSFRFNLGFECDTTDNMIQFLLPPFRGLSLSVVFVHCAQTAEDIDTITSAYGSLSTRSL